MSKSKVAKVAHQVAKAKGKPKPGGASWAEARKKVEKAKGK